MKVRIQWGNNDAPSESRVFDFEAIPRAGEEIVWREGVRTSLGGEGAFEYTTRVQYVFHLVDAMSMVTVKLYCQQPFKRELAP